MLGNLSESIHDKTLAYPIIDSGLPFQEYITRCRRIIEERRTDLANAANPQLIIDANSPFELYPEKPIRSGERIKYGALLIHGLFDCPYSVREIGKHLAAKGVLCRATLSPGHGTTPNDLLNVTYEDWLQTVRYGIETLRKEVDQIFLVGYSTGATLSVYHALQSPDISGMLLMAPALKIKAPVDTLFSLHHVMKWISSNRKWIYREKEVDYAKYISVTFNSVIQLNKLTEVLTDLHRHRPITCPVFVVISHEDETISSHGALDFFSNLPNPKNQLLLYTSHDHHRYPDARIITRKSQYPSLHINHISHVAIPYSATNAHYGQQGDYVNASHIDAENVAYGAYNPIEEKAFDFLYQCNLIKCKRRQLTYNPDFDYMAEKMATFLLSQS